MRKYLIAGCNGQLGKEFKRILLRDNQTATFMDIDTLDITKTDQVDKALKTYSPDVTINCTAYNNVDAAEADSSLAEQVNVEGVTNLATACQKYKSFLVHFSSNYVFDGNKDTPYTEDDVPCPINKYGVSKYLGEEEVKKILKNYLIIRLSWLYGEGEQNFIFKFLKRVHSNEELSGVTDEISTPTSTKMAADYTLKLLDSGITGLFHLAPSGYCSRHEWAQEILNILNIEKTIKPITLDSLNLKAPRPRNAVLDNTKFCRITKQKIGDWKYYLQDYLLQQKVPEKFS